MAWRSKFMREFTFLARTVGPFYASRVTSASTSCWVTPRISTRLLRLRWPETILTADLGVIKRCARNSHSASLARSSSAGACRRTFSAPPSTPAISVLLARGCARTGRTTAPSCACSWSKKLPRRSHLTLNYLERITARTSSIMREWYPIIITSVFTALSVFLKWLSRRDGDTSPFRNDFYVAQSLFMGSLSALAVYLIKSILAGNSDAGLSCSLLLLLYILVLVALAFLDRYFAWDTAPATPQRKWPLGVFVPNLLGVAGYFTVFFFDKSRHL